MQGLVEYIDAIGEPHPGHSSEGQQIQFIYAAQSANLSAVKAIYEQAPESERAELLNNIHYVRVVNGYRCATNATLEAATVGALDVLVYLNELGADFSVREEILGHTICHAAAFFGQFECLRYLVETLNIDPFILNYPNETPIANAVYQSERLGVQYTNHRFDCAAYLFALLFDADMALSSRWLANQIVIESIGMHFKQHPCLFVELQKAWERIGRLDLAQLFQSESELLYALELKAAPAKLKAHFPHIKANKQFLTQLKTKLFSGEQEGSLLDYLAELTERQRECLHYTLYGDSAKHIAQRLNLSPKTVEAHLASIREKFNCDDRQGLISKVVKLGYFNQ